MTLRVCSTHLLRHFRSGSELEESARERRARLVVLEFEEEVERRAQRQDQVHRLQIAVREVGGHLANAETSR